MADAIVVGRAPGLTGVPSEDGEVVELQISAVLKGDVQPGLLTVRLDRLQSFEPAPLREECIVFLRNGDAARKPGVMLDGTERYTAETAEQLKGIIAQLPAWAEPRDGLSTLLVPESFDVAAGDDLTLYVGYRNMSDQPITFRYQDWPLDTHTYWELNIVHEDGARVLPFAHPSLTPDEIQAYFSRFGRVYEVSLKPGEEHFFALPRVNTANPGWGYKEELDFKFYPMTRRGRYHISANARNLRTGHEVTAAGLAIIVK